MPGSKFEKDRSSNNEFGELFAEHFSLCMDGIGMSAEEPYTFEYLLGVFS
jgi:hypothetical protein